MSSDPREAPTVLMLTLALTTHCHAASPAAPTFQELMDPGVFPDAQRGMEVEYASHLEGGAYEVKTTGAVFAIDLRQGSIGCHQTIGHKRALAVLKTGRPWRGAVLTHHGGGFARLTVERPRLTVRINGDSLCMVQAHEPLKVQVERKIDVAWNASYGANHLLADEWGGFGLYYSDRVADDGYDPYGETVATYEMPADGVLWLGVCPPKPYDWERSFTDNVVWHWSNQLGYPPDEALRSWQPLGNTVLLQSEVMLWKDWNLDFVPRLGPEEFARVRRTLHDLGMRFIVYTSPYYFLKGTPVESHAFSSFEGFTNWPPGDGSGCNMGLFMAAITRVMQEHRPDGLYFDGQYTGDPAALYALARSTRELLGEEGLLEWHSTGALGPGLCYLPQADAYVDFILRGEGRGNQYEDLDYLRFFVSGYNLNNCPGVLCNNGPEVPTPELTERLLSVNGRYHTIAGWAGRPDIMQVLNEQYRPRLNPGLRETVDRGCDERQALVREKIAGSRAEREALQRPPKWGEPILSLDFDALPEAEQLISPQNPDPFSSLDGALHVRARAHTYAFLRAPVGRPVGGLTVRLRLGTDGGMSWGPAACLKWANGAVLRIGLRSDGKLQTDLLGQQLVGGAHQTQEPGQWIWLRARWLERAGVFESSLDGKTWKREWTFELGGQLTGDVATLSVGKVPYNGEPQDYTDAGAEGECEVDEVKLYPE